MMIYSRMTKREDFGDGEEFVLTSKLFFTLEEPKIDRLRSDNSLTLFIVLLYCIL